MNPINPVKLKQRISFINALSSLLSESYYKGQELTQSAAFRELTIEYRRQNWPTGFSSNHEKAYNDFKKFKGLVKNLISKKQHLHHVPTAQAPHYQRLRHFLQNSQSISEGSPKQNQ